MDEFNDIPDEVVIIGMLNAAGLAVGFRYWDEAVKKYPEHFPEETKRREIWDAIPQKVKDKHTVSVKKLRKEVYGVPELVLGKGLTHRMNHPEEYIEYDKEQNRLGKIFRIKEAILHKKYFSKYGYKKQ
jgi:hypothetical protein